MAQIVRAIACLEKSIGIALAALFIALHGRLLGEPWRQPLVGLTITKNHNHKKHNLIHSAQDGLNESFRNSPG
jgi:hypothetical protein